MELKVLTFNIQHCENFKTGQVDLPLYIRTLQSLNADIVGLNEVYSASDSSELRTQAAALAAGAGYPHVYFGEATKISGDRPYGNALLSKYPIRKAETVPIPDPAVRGYDGYYETRCVIKATLNVNGVPVNVLVTHFGLNPDEHENAVKTVCGLIEERCILMGDLNVTSDDPVLAPVFSAMQDTAAALTGEGLTFPSDRPDRKIDYIFITSDITALSAQVPALTVSDHRPYTTLLSIE
ncbi:MAG: endonuclease/exonuclease/phosphatase family protein [Clostridia bacterium]|nr:endonuclease/exonuclease/phosphatase family protein [Clostridia bacterium]